MKWIEFSLATVITVLSTVGAIVVGADGEKSRIENEFKRALVVLYVS